MEEAVKIVNEQAEDRYLWANPLSAHADYLQQALRRLHEAVEGKTAEQCARAVMD